MKLQPRFTVRTLAIFVTLVCAYFGTWDPGNGDDPGKGIPEKGTQLNSEMSCVRCVPFSPPVPCSGGLAASDG